jgi:hypothetical protein
MRICNGLLSFKLQEITHTYNSTYDFLPLPQFIKLHILALGHIYYLVQPHIIPSRKKEKRGRGKKEEGRNDTSLIPACKTYDFGIRLSIDTQFCYLIIKRNLKSKFLENEGMYLL